MRDSPSAHVEVRGQPLRVSSLLFLSGSLGLNSGCQVGQVHYLMNHPTDPIWSSLAFSIFWSVSAEQRNS